MIIIKKHKIIWFYVFTFIFTIVLGGLGQALCINFISKQYQTIVSVVIDEMAPTLGTFIICICIADWSCWKNMNWRLFKNMKSILLSFMISAAIVTGAAIIMSLIGKTYISNEYSSKLIIVTVVFSLLGCIGEEIGWRGFMLPAFNKKYFLFSSAVFTGILWGAWHFGKLMSYGILGYILFIVLITEFSIVMAWIYLKSNANMICMVFFHLGINTASIFLLTGREGIMFYTTACIISAFVCLVLVFTNKKKFFVNS